MAGTVENRGVKEIYIADYDGENQRRVTSATIAEHRAPLVARRALDRLHVVPPRRRRTSSSRTSTRARSTSSRRATVGENWLPAWSPDGTRIAFSSTRDGNSEIYVVNRDGSNVRRLTNHPGIDITPTWSPTGHADRVHVRSHRHAADLRHRRRRPGPAASVTSRVGYCDRPTWSPAPYNEIAYSVAHGPGLRHQGDRPGDRRSPRS